MLSLQKTLDQRKIYLPLIQHFNWLPLEKGQIVLTEAFMSEALEGAFKRPSWLKSLRVKLKDQIICAKIGFINFPELNVDFKVLDFRFNPANHYAVVAYTVDLNPFLVKGATALLNQFVFKNSDFMKVDQKNGEITIQFDKIKGFSQYLQVEFSEGQLRELLTVTLLPIEAAAVTLDLDIKGFRW